MQVTIEETSHSATAKEVDSFRFLDRLTAKLVRTWIGLEAGRDAPREIPWTPLSTALEESTVALISSAALALKRDRPFDQEGERQNPWWGDPSYRLLPRTVSEKDLKLYHLHVDARLAQEDMNTFFPAQRLLELEARGEIGAAAAHHASYMGYNLQPRTLLAQSVPAMIRQMKHDGVNVVVLVPV